MKPCPLLLFALALLPLHLAASAWDADSVCALFDGRSLDAVEGVWQFPDDGATMAIVRQSASTFAIYLIDSPDLSMQPGMHIGKAVATPKPGIYDAELITDAGRSGHKMRHTRARLSVNEAGSLLVEPYEQGRRLKLSYWLPYIFRFRLSVTDKGNRPQGMDGAVRIYPVTPQSHRPVL